MATRQSTSKAGSGRNRVPWTARGSRADREDSQRPSAAATDADADLDWQVTPLAEAIEDERDRLGKADSVLGCLSMALMDAEEGEHRDLPYFADVAYVARKLVRKSINKLDSARIGPLIERIQQRRERP